MLVSVLPVLFADAARQRQYEAVLAALGAEEDAPATVLLGNLATLEAGAADALIVRPGGLALLVLTPRAGHLTVPALTYGTWQLDGQPLPGRLGSDNPFAQYQQQLPPVLAWLSEQLNIPENELPPCLGVALFEAPLTFGPGVEAQLHHHPAAHAFELVGEAAQLPARLRQLLAAGATSLSGEELLDWGDYLSSELATAQPPGAAPSVSAILAQKLGQLWRWLGAEDIPADPPYGALLPDQHLRDQQEQARLQQLRQELQAELHQQRQEAASREVARTHELALLRQQLAQTDAPATERQAEQRAKAALEEALRTTRAELATRTQELDARIQQLSQLIKQLQAAPTAVPATGQTSTRQRRGNTAPNWSFRRLRQAERWGLVVLAWAGVGAGTWGLVRWVQHTAGQPATALVHSSPPASSAEAGNPVDLDVEADSLGRRQAEAVDTAVEAPTQPEPAASETSTSEAITPPVELHIDSAAAVVKPIKLLRGPDSVATDATTP